MIAELEPAARKLIVSSKGFSAPVAERAKATRIETLTYSDLFKKFVRFEPYVSSFLGDTPEAVELRRLSDIYEEPEFIFIHTLTRARVDYLPAARCLPRLPHAACRACRGPASPADSDVLRSRWLDRPVGPTRSRGHARGRSYLSKRRGWRDCSFRGSHRQVHGRWCARLFRLAARPRGRGRTGGPDGLGRL